MPASDWTESNTLAEWAEQECRHVDLIASWEMLLSVYDALGFDGPDNDEQRLSEFKAVITELNKFLTRMRNGLRGADSVEGAIEFLSGHSNTADMNAIKTRSTIAYNKLKQRWISQSIAVLLARSDLEGERDD